MESFNATLQEMIDCDMRAHLDSLSPSSVEVEAADVYDVSPWSQSHNQLVYSELETPSLFVNPQTAVPHTKSYVLQGSNLISDEECDVRRFEFDSTGDEKIQGGVKATIDGVKTYPKPAYSYSCLIAMALKNSETGSLPVSEIYGFMTENFPYFKTAPNGWKNSVRHNLSLNKCFEKVDKSSSSSSYGNKERKGCLWTMNPSKINKMNEEVQKWIRKDPQAIERSMARPETLELLSRGFQQEEKVELKKDVDVMTNNLQLDVSLPDLNLHTGIWDEFEAEVGFHTNSNILHLTNNNVNEHCKDAVAVVRGSV